MKPICTTESPTNSDTEVRHQMKSQMGLAKWTLLGLCSISLTSPPPAEGADAQIAHRDATPATFSDVPYGQHSRQTMDVWQARSNKLAPLVIYFHGGGWQASDKRDIHEHLNVRAFLDAGIGTPAGS
jgi:acetyl esterase/lipase